MSALRLALAVRMHRRQDIGRLDAIEMRAELTHGSSS